MNSETGALYQVRKVKKKVHKLALIYLTHHEQIAYHWNHQTRRMPWRALPTTLQEAIKYFSDTTRCLDLLIAMRWPHGPVCPRCDSQEYEFIRSRSLWECKGCKKQYSEKVRTIFEDRRH